MSESERRRKSPLTRVLIETERILSPQFDDAVLFLTGAQIEMLRNVTQYLNRISTYVSEYGLGYYLTPTTEDYDSILAIVADLEETLMGNPNTIWGYADRLYEPAEETSTGEAYTYVYTTAVPTGYVHVLEHWDIRHIGETTCNVSLHIDTGVNRPLLYDAPALSSNVTVYANTALTLKAGDRLRLRVTGLPDTKTAYLRIWGHTMVVP